MTGFSTAADRATTPLPAEAKSMAGKKLVLFDFDGTLVDGAEAGAIDVMQEAIQKFLDDNPKLTEGLGKIQLTKADFAGMTGKTTEAVVDAIIAAKELKLSDDDKKKLYKAVHTARENQEPGNDVEAIDEARKYLQYLMGKNIPFAIVTNSETKRVAKFLEKAGLLSYFKNNDGSYRIVSAHDHCGDKGKPGPEPYLKALEYYGQGLDGQPIDKKHVAVIEDSVPGVTAARAAGIEAVMGITASKAIKNKTERADELTTAGAARVFGSYKEIQDSHDNPIRSVKLELAPTLTASAPSPRLLRWLQKFGL